MPSLLESIAESASLVADVNPCVQQVATCHAVLDRLLHCLLYLLMPVCLLGA